MYEYYMLMNIKTYTHVIGLIYIVAEQLGNTTYHHGGQTLNKRVDQVHS